MPPPEPDIPVADEANGDGDGTEQIVDALLTASRLLVAIAARSLASVEHTLTLPQYRLLVVLGASGPSSLTRLAEQLDVNPSTALRMVERLSATGIVEKVANPQSKREVRLRLTSAGADVVQRVMRTRRDEIAVIVQSMEPGRRQSLVEALVAFSDAGGEPADGLPSLPGWH